MNEIQVFTRQSLVAAKQTRATANDLAATAEKLSGLLSQKNGART